MKKTGIRVDLVVGGVKGGLKVQNLIFGYLGSHTSGSNLIFRGKGPSRNSKCMSVCM